METISTRFSGKRLACRPRSTENGIWSRCMGRGRSNRFGELHSLAALKRQHGSTVPLPRSFATQPLRWVASRDRVRFTLQIDRKYNITANFHFKDRRRLVSHPAIICFVSTGRSPLLVHLKNGKLPLQNNRQCPRTACFLFIQHDRNMFPRPLAAVLPRQSDTV